MRIRTKKWARPELAVCPFYIDEPEKAAGTWKAFFKKEQPLHLDLGCGKCTFLAALAHRDSNVNFIGIERQETVVAMAARRADEELPNLAFVWENASESFSTNSEPG